MTIFLFMCVVAYLVGSLPTGKLISKLKGVDIQKVGTQNIGASNTYLVLGKKAGLLVLFGDLGKAFLMMWVALYILPTHQAAIASLLLLLGNVFSVFLKFTGGKGVATSLGIFLAIQPLVMFVLVGFWIIGLLFEKYLLLVSVLAPLIVPLAYYQFGHDASIILSSFLICVIMLICHRNKLKVNNEKISGIQEV